jgi:ferritin
MISEKMQEKLNQAANLEFQSAYLYLSMAAYCHSIGLDGFAHWLRVQYGEEMGHGMKMLEYINEQQGRIKLHAMAEPKHEWSSIVEVMDETLAHEKKVTAAYHDLMGYAHEVKDYATQAHLQWYVTEQVEEESAAASVVEKLKVLSKSPHGALLLDRDMGKRADG